MSAVDSATPPPRTVFISYSHDSQQHMDNVLNLAKRLRGEGVPCELDQFHESPAEGWPRWTLDQIEQASFVLVICTEIYNLRFRGKAPAGQGKGAKWEGAVITQELYESEAQNTIFIPVLLNSDDARNIPILLKGTTYYDLSQKDGFINLLRRLTAQPRIVAPPVAKSVRRITDDEAELAARQFDKEVGTDVQYYTAKLGSWPGNSFNGEDVIPALQGTLEKVEGNIEYREQYRHIWATVYRMLGGAYLLHSKLEMGDKLRSALPKLRQSREIWPEQQGLEHSITFFETFLRNQGGDIKEYLTNVLQILRGPADPEIPTLVEKLSGAAQSPERKAQSWLLNEATPSPIWNFLQAVQLMLKKERNIDAEIEVTTNLLQEGHVEVQAKIGPNIFLWEVDLTQKTFQPKNELTQGFMGLIAGAKA
ncbi:MAG TPA: toll/interleukin-1 receptor domain-containing protein [Candidatus Angelobacter sp.]